MYRFSIFLCKNKKTKEFYLLPILCLSLSLSLCLSLSLSLSLSTIYNKHFLFNMFYSFISKHIRISRIGHKMSSGGTSAQKKNGRIPQQKFTAARVIPTFAVPVWQSIWLQMIHLNMTSFCFIQPTRTLACQTVHLIPR